MLREKILKKLGYKTRPIEDLIAEERKKWESDLIEQIEKMIKYLLAIAKPGRLEDQVKELNEEVRLNVGYNLAIKEVINLLKK